MTERIRGHRAKLREKGLRPIQLWVPDLRTAQMQAEIRHQCIMLNQADQCDHVMDFIDDLTADIWGAD